VAGVFESDGRYWLATFICSGVGAEANPVVRAVRLTMRRIALLSLRSNKRLDISLSTSREVVTVREPSVIGSSLNAARYASNAVIV